LHTPRQRAPGACSGADTADFGVDGGGEGADDFGHFLVVGVGFRRALQHGCGEFIREAVNKLFARAGGVGGKGELAQALFFGDELVEAAGGDFARDFDGDALVNRFREAALGGARWR